MSSRIELNGMDSVDLRRKVVGSVVRIGGEISKVDYVRLCRGDDDNYIDDEDDYDDDSVYLLLKISRKGTNTSGKMVWDNTTLRVEESDDSFFDLSFPEPGYVNYKGGSLYVTRLAARQWHLGLNPSCTTISDKFSEERRVSEKVIDMDSIFDNLHFLDRMYNRRYMSYENVIYSILTKQRIGGSINRYVYIGRNLLMPHMVICYKDTPVGYVDRETLTPYLFSPAEYVQKVLPVRAQIKENNDGIVVRTKWY